MIKKIVKVLLIIVISNSLVIKAFSIEPDVFIQSAVNRATKALGAEDKTELYKALRSIAEDTVDINGIGLYSLGSYRKTLTKDQSIKYQSLFREYFLKSFCSRLEEYTNPEINVISKKKLNENYTIVSSILEKTEVRPAINIEWRVYTKDENSPLIRDLIIEGLSLARTQREEFNSVIQSADGDIQALFNNLKKFIES